MKILTFQARRFQWSAHSKTLADAPDLECDETVEDAVVAFLHAERSDEAPEQRARVIRHTVKHLKWLANKREFKRIVLHSFAHLGGSNADPDFARELLETISSRLEGRYEVSTTPFGYFCSWEISVYGESLAKVWKEV